MNDELDPISAVTAANPATCYAAMAAEPALEWHEGRGLWVAAHPVIAREVLDHPACRVRPAAQPVPSRLVGTPAGALFAGFARMRDGDNHRRGKQAISRALDAIDPADIREATVRQAALVPRDDLDRFCHDVPVRAVAALLGIPDTAVGPVAGWTRDLVRCVLPVASPLEIDAGCDAAARLDRVLRRLLAAPHPPALLGAMYAAFRVERLPVDVAVANAVGLLFQTHDATAGLIGNAIVQLVLQPLAGQEPIDAVIACIAQRDPSVHNTRRFVAEDAVIAGQPVRAGDAIVVVLAAAGTAEPDRLWTFGYGPHACLGRSIALVIAAAAIEFLSRRELFPVDLPERMRYCPLANVRIPVFAPASAEVSS